MKPRGEGRGCPGREEGARRASAMLPALEPGNFAVVGAAQLMYPFITPRQAQTARRSEASRTILATGDRQPHVEVRACAVPPGLTC